MSRAIATTIAVGVIGGLTFTTPGHTATPAPGAVATAPNRDGRIEALLAMPRAQRREEIKKLAPTDRKALVQQLRKLRAERRASQARKGAYREEPHAISVRPKPRRVPQAVGTITYDSGFPSLSFGGGALVGNRFNTHTGVPVFASGTVNTIQALVVPGQSLTMSVATVVILGPQTTMGGAPGLFTTTAAASGAIATINLSGLGVNYTGSSFFVLLGDFATAYVPALGTGTNLGQGGHGVVGYTGGMFPNITGTFNFGNALNSFLRATGNIVPVELMTFEVK